MRKSSLTIIAEIYISINLTKRLSSILITIKCLSKTIVLKLNSMIYSIFKFSMSSPVFFKFKF